MYELFAGQTLTSGDPSEFENHVRRGGLPMWTSLGAKPVHSLFTNSMSRSSVCQ